MSRRKNTVIVGPPPADDIIKDERKVAIKDASINDGFCNYSYEILRGFANGDTINRKGSKVIHPDLYQAFKRVHVHLAFVDDAFHHSAIEIDDIDRYHDHSITDMYRVDAIRIKGTEENARVVIIGSKHLTLGGRMKAETPPVSLTTAYKWYNELNTAVQNIIREVELYMDGKHDETVEQEDNQLEMTFGESFDFENAAQ